MRAIFSQPGKSHNSEPCAVAIARLGNPICDGSEPQLRWSRVRETLSPMCFLLTA